MQCSIDVNSKTVVYAITQLPINKYSTMRRLLHLTLLCLLISLSTSAQVRVWVNRSGDGLWNNPANWSLTTGGLGGASVPGIPGNEGFTAIFNSGGTSNCTINQPITLANLQVRAGYTGTITQSQPFVVNGPMSLVQGNFNSNATLNVTSGFAQTGGILNMGNANSSFGTLFYIDGGSFVTGSGNISFTGDRMRVTNPVSLVANTGTFTFEGNLNTQLNVVGGTRAVRFNNVVLNKTNDPGNLSITNGATLISNNLDLIDGTIHSPAPNAQGVGAVQVEGNLTTSAAFSPTNLYLRLIFGGGNNQIINLNPATTSHFNGTVSFNKTGGAITLASNFILDQGAQNIDFTGGIINSTLTNLIYFGSVNVTGGNNSSYVDGPVEKIGDRAFTFPVGDGGFYAPIHMSGTTAFGGLFIGGSKTYIAQYFHTSPDPLYETENKQSTDPNLVVSLCEYWRVTQVGTVSLGQRPYLWLSFENTRSCGLTDPSTVGVMAWLGSDQWATFGNGNTTTQGGISYIRSGSRNTTVNEVDPVFTFGTIDVIANPLPVKWLDFTGRFNNTYVDLNWSTTSELNNEEFSIERSSNGTQFTSMGTVPGNLTTNLISHYSFTDKDPLSGASFYRIKQTDLDGKYSYSDIIRVSSSEASRTGIRIFPNPLPTGQVLTIENSNFRNKKVNITIFNSIGSIVHQDQVSFGNDGRTQLKVTRFQKGTYFISTQLNGEKQVHPIVVQ
jgi:hypothetical protein